MLAKLEGELDTLDRLNTLELKPYQFIEDEIYKNLVIYNDMYDQGAVDSILNFEIASRVNDLIMRNSEFTTHFNQNHPDDRLPDARFHIEHAESIKRNREASLKSLTQSQDNSGIKTLFSEVLKVSDTACRTNALHEEAVKNIQTGKQFITELQGLSSTDMSSADTLKSTERVKL